MGSERTAHLLLALCLAVGLLARVASVGYGLPDVYHPDEPRIVVRAVRIHAGEWNPRFFNWPSLYMYLLSGVYGLTFGLFGRGSVPEAFARDPAPFYLMGRLLTALSGTATIAALYGLARRTHGTRVALVAAAFLAVDLLHVRDSAWVTTDVPLALLVTLSVRAAFRFSENGRPGTAAVSGLWAGLATSMKYPGGLAFLALAAAQWGRGPGRTPAWRRLGTGAVGGAIVAATLGFFAGTPFALLTPVAFVAGVVDEVREVGTVQFGNEGDLPASLFHLGHSLPEAMGWPLTVLALVGVGLLIRAGGSRAWMLLAFPAPYLLVIATWSSRFERYVIPLLPFLALFAAVAVAALVARLVPAGGVKRGLTPGVVMAVLCGLLIAPAALRIALFHRLLHRPDTRVLAAEWIERVVPPGTRIALEPYTPSLPLAPAMLREMPREKLQLAFATAHPPAAPGGATADARGYWVLRLDAYDLDRLVADRVEYVVLSGFVYQRHRRACDRHPAPCRFYEALERRGRLVFVVSPGVDDEGLWVGDIYSPLTRLRERRHPGPPIRIYRLSPPPPPPTPEVA